MLRMLTTGFVSLFLITSAIHAEEAKLPKLFLEECEYFVGEWSTEIEHDGTTYTGKWVAEWSKDKTCLVSWYEATTPTGPLRGTRVQGWDALSEQGLVVDFCSDGSSSIERYTLTKNKVSEGEISRVDEEGKPVKQTVRTVREAADFFTWTITEGDQVREHRFRRVGK